MREGEASRAGKAVKDEIPSNFCSRYTYLSWTRLAPRLDLAGSGGPGPDPTVQLSGKFLISEEQALNLIVNDFNPRDQEIT